jgi:hypothetical protein
MKMLLADAANCARREKGSNPDLYPEQSALKEPALPR